MIIKHECKVCGNKFELVNGETLKEDELGEYTITYAECPVCLIADVVQVDNKETKEILRKIISKVSLIRVSSNKVSKRQSAQLKNLNAMLDKKRKELFEKYVNCAVNE